MGWEGEGRNHFDQISAVYNEVITCIIYYHPVRKAMGRKLKTICLVLRPFHPSVCCLQY